MKVRLANCGNPDHGQNPDQPVWGCPEPFFKKASSLKEASKICVEYIEDWRLTGSQWNGGQIYDGDEQVAKVSYNGRVWGMNDREIKI